MSINRESFLKILESVKAGLANKEIMEQSTHFIFQKGKVATYNDEVAISHPVDLDITAAVPSDKLLSYLKRSKSEELDVTILEGELHLSGGRSKVGIKIDSDIKLNLDEIGKPKNWSDIPEDMLKGMEFCAFSASSDMTKPILTCINVKGQWVESADDFRLTRYKMTSKIEDKITIPALSAKKLSKFKVVSYALTNGWIHFKTEDGVIFSCHNYSLDFPDLRDFLEVEGTTITTPKRLPEMVERARIFSSSDFEQDEKVTVILADNSLSIEGRGDQGWCRESAKMEYDGPELKFQIHPEFLVEMVGLLNEITIGDPNDECGKIKMEGDNFIHIVSMMADVPVEAPKKKSKKKIEDVEE